MDARGHPSFDGRVQGVGSIPTSFWLGFVSPWVPILAGETNLLKVNFVVADTAATIGASVSTESAFRFRIRGEAWGCWIGQGQRRTVDDISVRIGSFQAHLSDLVINQQRESTLQVQWRGSGQVSGPAGAQRVTVVLDGAAILGGEGAVRS